MADPATQVTNQLGGTGGTQPTDVALVGFKITPTGEDLTWSDLVVSLTYGGGKKKQGAAEVVARATELMVKRMERNREIHSKIRRLPLSDRARRLRDLDAARR